MRTRCQACFASPSRTPRETRWFAPTQIATRQVAGAAPRCLDRRETLLCDRPKAFVAQTSRGNPPGHMPGVRFMTREPAAVIQTVVHCMLQNRFADSESAELQAST